LTNDQGLKRLRPNAVKRALKDRTPPRSGTWLSLGSITAARVSWGPGRGFAWLTVDHRAQAWWDWETATHMFRVRSRTPVCVALGRACPSNRHDHIKARCWTTAPTAIVVPMVNSRAEAEGGGVGGCCYPPHGNRSVGRQPWPRAQLPGPTANDYYAPRPTDELLVVLQCEHIQAVEDADKIFFGAGHRPAIFVGPKRPGGEHCAARDGKGPERRGDDAGR